MNEKQQLAANQAIAAFMGLCWHNWTNPQGKGFKIKLTCSHCGNSTFRSHCHMPPEYTSRLTARYVLEEVEAKCIAEFGAVQMTETLVRCSNEWQVFAAFSPTLPRVWAILDVLDVRQEIEALADKGE